MSFCAKYIVYNILFKNLIEFNSHYYLYSILDNLYKRIFLFYIYIREGQRKEKVIYIQNLLDYIIKRIILKHTPRFNNKVIRLSINLNKIL